MGDGGLLSALGYKSMWFKLTDVCKGDTFELPTKLLNVSCEKRVPSATKKLWIGSYCSMAMAAHAFDLIAEAFGWTERHYGKSETLISRAAELKQELGEIYSLDDKTKTDTITEHARRYASLFPCSDSKEALLTCFESWVKAKGAGPTCFVRIEKPLLPDNMKENQFYPHDLLPPIVIPGKREKPLYESFKNYKKRKQFPVCVRGTRDIQDEMDVEPDSVSCIEVDDSNVSCFLQQWTWSTRMSKSEMNQRRWGASPKPYAASLPTHFHESPLFITGSRDCRPFSFRNYQVYHKINNDNECGKPRYPICEWKGTSVNKFNPDPPEQAVDSSVV